MGWMIRAQRGQQLRPLLRRRFETAGQELVDHVMIRLRLASDGVHRA
jgi:hypothetical protein